MSSVGNNVPVASGSIAAVVGVAEMAVAVCSAGINKVFAYFNPPFAIGMRLFGRGEAVPRVVHHLGASVQVGAESEIVIGDIIDHRSVLLLLRIHRLGSKGIGVVAVEVDVVGVVSCGAAHGVVAAAIGAVGIAEGIDIDAGGVEQLRVLSVAAVTFQQCVDEAEHHYVACHLVAVHSGAIEEFGSVKVVIIRPGDVHTENQTSFDRGADSVDPA